MRSMAAVTTCNSAGYERYGRRMVESFDRHWPTDVPLLFYTEGFQADKFGPRVVCRDLHATCPELVEFKDRHRGDPVANGLEARGSRLLVRVKWHKCKVKVRRLEWGTGYRWDAVRFSHKAFALFDAAERCGADVLFWVDADIVVFDSIPQAFLEELVPADCLLACLKRPTFSECGFVAYNLRHPDIRDFFAEFKALYTSDRLFDEEQFHDSWLFDVIRKRFERRGCKTFDIAEGEGARAGHIFINSKLGRYMDHMKGGRWALGSSRPDDLVAPRDEAYWRLLAN